MNSTSDSGQKRQLREQIADAKRAGDKERELKARIDLSTHLARTGDPTLIDHFEESLPLVRQEKDRRREYILCNNVVQALLASGQPDRAMEIAKRALELASGSRQLVRARLALGDIWLEGFGSPGQALTSWQEALDELDRYEARSPDRAASFIAELLPVLSRIAESALECEEIEFAARLARRIKPDLELSEPVATAPGADTQAQRERAAMTEVELCAILGVWHGFALGEQPNTAAMRLKDMAELAQIHGWSDAADHLRARSAQPPPAKLEGFAAALALLDQAERFATGHCALEDAANTARENAPSTDDLPCLVFYWLALMGGGRGRGCDALPQIATIICEDDLLAARIARMVVTYRQIAKDYRGSVRFAQFGVERLGDGDVRLRADFLNEIAFSLTEIGADREALESALLAADVAREIDAAELAAGALVNASRALQQLDRHQEAIALLEDLLAGSPIDESSSALAAARYNLEISRIAIGRLDIAGELSADASPDELALAAQAAQVRGDPQAEILLYKRLIANPDNGINPAASEGEYGIRLARALRQVGRSAESASVAQKAREWFQGTGWVEGYIDATLALAGVRGDDPELQMRLADEALECARRLHDSARAASARFERGMALASRESYDDAIEEVGKAIAEGVPDVGFAKITLAALLTQAGRPAEALVRFQVLLDEEPRPDDAMRMHVGCAEALTLLDRNEEALDAYERAYTLARQLPGNANAIPMINNYGAALNSAERFNEAFDVLNEGLVRARAASSLRDEAMLLTNFSNGLIDSGQLGQAEETLERAADLARRISDAKQEGLIIFALANVSQAQGNNALARERFLSAMYLGEQTGDRRVEAGALDMLGTLFSTDGESERAVEYHRRAARLFGEVRAPFSQVLALLHLSQAHLLLDEVGPAEKALDEAKQVAETHDVQVSEGVFDLNEAALSAARGNWPVAEKGFDAALLEIERARLAVGSPRQQQEWMEKRVASYRLAEESAIKANKPEVAFRYSEWNRTRYLNAFVRRRDERPRGLNPQTWLRYRAAADELAEARGRARNELALNGADPEDVLADAEQEYTRALADLVREGGSEVALPGAAELPTSAELVAQLPPGTVAVTFSTFNCGLGVVALWSDTDGRIGSACAMEPGFRGRDLDLLVFGDRAAWQAAQRAGNDLNALPDEAFGWVVVTQTELRRRLWRRTVTRICRELGARLWPVIEQALPKTTTRVVLLPGPGFNVLPVHAAKLADGSYALDRYRVSYAPSIRLLGALGPVSPLPENPSVGLASNPTGDLYFSDFESADIAGRLPKEATTRYPGEAATAAKVLHLLESHDIFHFAGHGAFIDEEPLESRLFCAPTDQDSGSLTLGTILTSVPRIASRWVVLSACETGRVEASDRLQDSLGLTGGFLTVGADLVLGAFWRVDDLATALLMERWYSEVFGDGDGGTPVVKAPELALAQAQRWLREDVTVGYVADRLGKWVAASESTDPYLQNTFEFWRLREDVDSFPFKDPVYWAAFHITGRPWANTPVAADGAQ